jgi:hypothetical protein
MAMARQVPLITAARCGNRAFATGEGTILHRSSRAINLQFGRKVITLMTGPQPLSPSSILLDLPALPDIREACFEGDLMSTDAFAMKVGSFADLRFRNRGIIDTRYATRSLRPWILPYDRSIAKAMLISLYDISVSSRGLERDLVVRQERAFRESGSPGDLARRLLGIGYGLTPSGDDFILGLIAVLSLQGSDLTEISAIVRGYDNAFSRTILEDACAGSFPEPLLGLMNHLAAGVCPPDAVEALINVGSTSGRDTLAGMYYALYHSGPGSGWVRDTGTAGPGWVMV